MIDVSNLREKLTELDVIETTPRLPEDQQSDRLNICKMCEQLKFNFCKLCGCYMPEKTSIPDKCCPINKWGVIKPDV